MLSQHFKILLRQVDATEVDAAICAVRAAVLGNKLSGHRIEGKGNVGVQYKASLLGLRLPPQKGPNQMTPIDYAHPRFASDLKLGGGRDVQVLQGGAKRLVRALSNARQKENLSIRGRVALSPSALPKFDRLAAL